MSNTKLLILGSGLDKAKKKQGGYKRALLSQGQIDEIMASIEEDPEITLNKVKQEIFLKFGATVCISTVSNYLDGQLMTFKKLHHRPITMNTDANKQLRKSYVQRFNTFVQHEKDLVYIDETNFNLFCRRSNSWSRKGLRAVQDRPAARGPNLHVIGAISNEGIVKMSLRRGAFRSVDAKNWLDGLCLELTSAVTLNLLK